MTPDEVAARLQRAAAGLGPALRVTVQHQATLLSALVMANASGRPGPNVITGAYRASWQVRVRGAGVGAVGTVGTNAPQARRLEFGFAGTDSLGRTYAQPPFPHAGPAVHDREAVYPKVFRRTVAELLS